MTNMKRDKENSPPSWLDNAFLETALQSGEKDPTVTVVSSQIKAATVAGDNYASFMYRASVKIKRGAGGETEDRSIIIKASKPDSEGELSKVLRKMDIFQQEIVTFTVAIPVITGLLNKIPNWVPQIFSAKHIYSRNDDQIKTIVLEDLKVQGFKLAETKLGLDLKHCLLVLKNIARYHAASVVAHHEDPQIFKDLMENCYCNAECVAFAPFFNGSVRNCGKEVEKWPEYKERFADKLNNLADRTLDEWLRAMIRDDTGFHVLIHGDFWAHNMMFRYSDDTGEVEDVRFVDFQLSYWTSPAIDLLYFLNSSAAPDVLKNPKILIQEYYSNLCDTLTLLGHGHLKPTATQLKDELEKRGLFGVMSAITIRTVALPDRNNISDIDKVVANEEDMNFSEAYKASIKELLPVYEERGWI